MGGLHSNAGENSAPLRAQHAVSFSGSIVDFKPAMTEQVRSVIFEVLRSIDFSTLPVIDAIKDSPIQNADLDHISEIYQGRGGFWVFLEDGAVAGTVAIQEKSDEVAQLARMFVLPRHHGTGLGQALLRHALQFAYRQGYSEVVLETWRVLHRAHRFYERNGFVRIHEDDEQFDYRLNLSDDWHDWFNRGGGGDRR